MRRPLASLVATVLGVLTLLLAPPATANTSAAPTAFLTADFSRTSTWEGGYQGRFTIRNSGSAPISGWTVGFDLPANTSVSTHWDSLLTRNGTWYEFRNAGYNGTLAPGASTSFGWVSRGTGLPAYCTVNRAPCGSEDFDTRPPTVPTGINFTSVEETSLTVNWAPSTDNRSTFLTYEVSIDGAAPSTVPGATSYRVSGLRPASGYLFRIRATDLAGNTSEYSPAVLGRTSDVRPPPRTMPTAPYVDMGRLAHRQSEHPGIGQWAEELQPGRHHLTDLQGDVVQLLRSPSRMGRGEHQRPTGRRWRRQGDLRRRGR
ncbi:cellulose binding domain-containing protein [Streptomyces albipurpureus]|uniref:Cellulose binding domain-containing protein n=1 Tax=Streptomyces albipurpureus TaxID=2897419 RepID=A0ABT0UIQ2_9ACTN|nr:cellulose binding domain-containing protein [Streptomyces sp. CWNU-1]MCM2387323.1 cellulose binding domain-containing protein [Streptomyces sp. CWNU-1]